jgi:hypothetical protein
MVVGDGIVISFSGVLGFCMIGASYIVFIPEMEKTRSIHR